MQCYQEANKPANAFLKRLKEIINQCEYNTIVTNLMDLFIFGMQLISTQNLLLKEDKDLTIAMALCIAETKEATSKKGGGTPYSTGEDQCKPADSVVETITRENTQQRVKHVLNAKRVATLPVYITQKKRTEIKDKIPKEQKSLDIPATYIKQKC